MKNCIESMPRRWEMASEPRVYCLLSVSERTGQTGLMQVSPHSLEARERGL
jgi:hypothetical protein